MLIFCFVLFYPRVAATVVNMTWCVSETEMNKCREMMRYVKQYAAAGEGVQVNTECAYGLDSMECIKKIEKGEADLVTLDGGFIFTAGTA